jgi:hypothetical protein
MKTLKEQIEKFLEGELLAWTDTGVICTCPECTSDLSEYLAIKLANLVHQIDKESTKGAESDVPKDGVKDRQKTE